MKTNIVESVYLKNLEYAHSWRQNRAERFLETRVRRTVGFIDEVITGVVVVLMKCFSYR